MIRGALPPGRAKANPARATLANNADRRHTRGGRPPGGGRRMQRPAATPNPAGASQWNVRSLTASMSASLVAHG
jgi:hypothetical protein